MQRTDAFRALQLFVAAFAALAIAMSLGLTNPFWAAMPVWVVNQPFRQDLVIRGALRFGGTIAGAIFGIAVLSIGPDPVTLVLALALAVGLGVGTAYWIGTVYSYGATLFALTVSVILLPVVTVHAEPIPLAMDRALCTLIGVASVTLTTFFFTPKKPDVGPLRIRHNKGSALQRGLIAACFAAAGMTLVLGTGQVVAMGGALALCVFATVLGSMPDPRPALKFMVPGVLIAVLAATAYRSIITGFHIEGLIPLLALSAVFIAGGAILRAHPKTAPLGLDSNMCFLLAGEVGGPGHALPVQITSALALLAGACLCVYTYRRVLHRHFAE